MPPPLFHRQRNDPRPPVLHLGRHGGVAGEDEDLPFLGDALQDPEGAVAPPSVPVHQRLIHEEGQALAVGVEVADDREAKRQVDLFPRAL